MNSAHYPFSLWKIGKIIPHHDRCPAKLDGTQPPIYILSSLLPLVYNLSDDAALQKKAFKEIFEEAYLADLPKGSMEFDSGSGGSGNWNSAYMRCKRKLRLEGLSERADLLNSSTPISLLLRAADIEADLFLVYPSRSDGKLQLLGVEDEQRLEWLEPAINADADACRDKLARRARPRRAAVENSNEAEDDSDAAYSESEDDDEEGAASGQAPVTTGDRQQEQLGLQQQATEPLTFELDVPSDATGELKPVLAAAEGARLRDVAEEKQSVSLDDNYLRIFWESFEIDPYYLPRLSQAYRVNEPDLSAQEEPYFLYSSLSNMKRLAPVLRPVISVAATAVTSRRRTESYTMIVATGVTGENTPSILAVAVTHTESVLAYATFFRLLRQSYQSLFVDPARKVPIVTNGSDVVDNAIAMALGDAATAVTSLPEVLSEASAVNPELGAIVGKAAAEPSRAAVAQMLDEALDKYKTALASFKSVAEKLSEAGRPKWADAYKPAATFNVTDNVVARAVGADITAGGVKNLLELILDVAKAQNRNLQLLETKLAAGRGISFVGSEQQLAVGATAVLAHASLYATRFLSAVPAADSNDADGNVKVQWKDDAGDGKTDVNALWKAVYDVPVADSDDHAMYKLRQVLALSDYTVNLEAGTCTCGFFQMNRAPCPHAMAVIQSRGLDPSAYVSIPSLAVMYSELFKKPLLSLTGLVGADHFTAVAMFRAFCEEAATPPTELPQLVDENGMPIRRKRGRPRKSETRPLTGSGADADERATKRFAYPSRDRPKQLLENGLPDLIVAGQPPPVKSSSPIKVETDNYTRNPPHTMDEALMRASEAVDIASYDEFDNKWFVRWRDCHPSLVSAVEDFFFDDPQVPDDVRALYHSLKNHEDADKYPAVPPTTIVEARTHAQDIVGISGYHPPSGVVTLQWRDCNPRRCYALSKIFLGHQGVLPPNMKRSAISILKQLKSLYDRIEEATATATATAAAAAAAAADAPQIAPEHDPALSGVQQDV